jgi:hypothetical protein
MHQDGGPSLTGHSCGSSRHGLVVAGVRGASRGWSRGLGGSDRTLPLAAGLLLLVTAAAAARRRPMGAPAFA